jgi:hypothetical protein
MLAQARRRTLSVEIAGERHATLRESQDDPSDQSPDHDALLEVRCEAGAAGVALAVD